MLLSIFSFGKVCDEGKLSEQEFAKWGGPACYASAESDLMGKFSKELAIHIKECYLEGFKRGELIDKRFNVERTQIIGEGGEFVRRERNDLPYPALHGLRYRRLQSFDEEAAL